MNGAAMVAPGRVELPTFGLGNRCSIHLSYGADASFGPLSHVDFLAQTSHSVAASSALKRKS